ncbi:MAG: sugar kinase [Streptococcaceae bacterium]|nr:sugar kinase [Streptococcaceae bacterium]
MAEFLTLGEPLVVLASKEKDVSLDEVVDFEKFLAGAELNVAVGMARLGNQVAYISKVGSDPFGNFIVSATEKAGIEVQNLTQDADYLTGFYLKQRVSQGDPATAYFRKNSAAANLTCQEVESVSLDDVKIAHLSGIFAALSETAFETYTRFNERLNTAKIMTIFDPNLRPSLWRSREKMVRVTNESAKNAHIILPGIDEGEILTGSREPEVIADFYLNQSELTHTVVVKLGAVGAFVKTKGHQKFTVPGFKVEKVVDTVGAGDGFAVGLESALLEDWSLEDAVRRACAIGAIAVQSSGDNDGYPTREELVEFLNKNTERGKFSC